MILTAKEFEAAPSAADIDAEFERAEASYLTESDYPDYCETEAQRLALRACISNSGLRFYPATRAREV